MKRRTEHCSAAPAAATGTVAAVLFLSYACVLRSRESVEWGIRSISRPLRSILGRLTEYVPFSVMELLYLAAGLLLLAHAYGTLRRVIAGKGMRLRILLIRSLSLLAALALVLSGYCWLWGLDYRGAGFEERSGFSAAPVDAAALRRTTRFFLERAKEAATALPRDEEGRIRGDPQTVLAAYDGLCDPLTAEFPMLDGPSYRPKAMVASRLMSRLGFTGVYFPFTGESNLNIDEPLSLLPHTLAHELCHQRGAYEEDVCNFLGVLACVKSEDPRFQYAGWFAGLIYLMNELYTLDRAAWRELLGEFDPLLLGDWEENNNYWARFEGKTEEMAGKVYDGYLKTNGQDLGLLSYSACVRFLVAYFDPAV